MAVEQDFYRAPGRYRQEGGDSDWLRALRLSAEAPANHDRSGMHFFQRHIHHMGDFFAHKERCLRRRPQVQVAGFCVVVRQDAISLQADRSDDPVFERGIEDMCCLRKCLFDIVEIGDAFLCNVTRQIWFFVNRRSVWHQRCLYFEDSWQDFVIYSDCGKCRLRLSKRFGRHSGHLLTDEPNFVPCHCIAVGEGGAGIDVFYVGKICSAHYGDDARHRTSARQIDGVDLRVWVGTAQDCTVQHIRQR